VNVDQLPERSPYGQLHDARLANVSGQREQHRAGVVLGALAAEPFQPVFRFPEGRLGSKAQLVYHNGLPVLTVAGTPEEIGTAVGALAGCAYATCADLRGSLTHAAMGPRARVVPMFQENGSADTVNNRAMAATLTSSWIGAKKRFR